MKTTYHIKPSEVDHNLMKTIRDLFRNEEELTITVSSTKEKKIPLDEKEELFYRLYGSWESDETGDELVKQMRQDLVSNTREVEL